MKDLKTACCVAACIGSIIAAVYTSDFIASQLFKALAIACGFILLRSLSLESKVTNTRQQKNR